VGAAVDEVDAAGKVVAHGPAAIRRAAHVPEAAAARCLARDGTRIEIQSAMLSADGRSMNICIIPVPAEWLARKTE
jgi:hypothetical protein